MPLFKGQRVQTVLGPGTVLGFEVIKYMFDNTLFVDQKAYAVNTIVFFTHNFPPLEMC